MFTWKFVPDYKECGRLDYLWSSIMVILNLTTILLYLFLIYLGFIECFSYLIYLPLLADCPSVGSIKSILSYFILCRST